MKKIKFIHTADLHIDTPFRTLSSINRDLAGRLKNATLRSFETIVDLCISEKVDFLLVSGDIFDGESKSLASQLQFVRGLQRLSDAGIRGYIICGNHDPLDSWMKNLSLPENTVRFGSSGVEFEVYEKDGRALAGIYGISYQTSREKRNLAGKFRIEDSSLPFSIAMLHGTVGNPGPHASYCPFRVEDVETKGFDYWALGHIHKKQIVRSSDPAIVYPGNPQGRDFGETGERGCFLVEMIEDGRPDIQFIPTRGIRFEKVEISLEGLSELNDLFGLLENAGTAIRDSDENSSYILRIVLKGRTALHTYLNNPEEMENLREGLNSGQLGEDPFIWIDSISVETRPDIDLEKLREGNDFTSEILKEIEQTDTEELFGETEKEGKLPGAVAKLVSVSTEDEEKLMERVRWMLIGQLQRDE
jgi:DNA repair exonuclease SbcCD nuclease subunit